MVNALTLTCLANYSDNQGYHIFIFVNAEVHFNWYLSDGPSEFLQRLWHWIEAAFQHITSLNVFGPNRNYVTICYNHDF